VADDAGAPTANPYQATARWLIGVFGATVVAAVTAVGLHPPQDPVHPRSALVAAIIGGLAAGAVLVVAIWVQLAQWALPKLAGRQEDIETSQGFGQLPPDPTDRWTKVADADKKGVLYALWLARLPAPAELLSHGLDPKYRPEVYETLSVAEAFEARRRFLCLRVVVLVALPVVLITLGVASWSLRETGVPDHPSADRPVAVTVRLRVPPARAAVPAGCVTDGSFDGIAVGGTWVVPQVVTLGGSRCPSTRVNVPPAFGSVTPQPAGP